MSLVQLLCNLTVDCATVGSQSPLIKRAKQELSMHTDDMLISIACGTILAVLTIAFFI